jgi:hypothetical protein
MFQWLYDFFMQHIMPLISAVFLFLGVEVDKHDTIPIAKSDEPKSVTFAADVPSESDSQ